MVQPAKTITDVLDTDYREYAMYTISNRAIPCYIDGLKPVHRKVLYSMIHNFKDKRGKVSEVGASIVPLNYHHGETSAMGAVVTLAANYNNNVPILNQHGAFGTRLIPESAAPRYIFTSLNQDFYKYFSDFDVLEYYDDEDDGPEPKTYLPNVPWVLVNGIKGIAVGFATSILPHGVSDVASLCLDVLEGKDISDKILKPSFPEFTGTVETVDHNKFTTYGTVTKISDKLWEITEVPVGYSREKYFNILVKLVDSGKIKDFDDLCSNTFKFLVKTDKHQSAIIEKDPIKFFKLESSYTEIYTTLDENSNLVIFDSKADIIKRFVDYRLEKIKHQLEYTADKISKKITSNEAKVKFINEILNGNIDLKKLSRDSLVNVISSSITTNTELQESLLRIPVYQMTTDNVNSLLETIENDKSELNKVLKQTPHTVYKKRLEALL